MIGFILTALYFFGVGFHFHVEYEAPDNDASAATHLVWALGWPVVWAIIGVLLLRERLAAGDE
jgi:hypothetical protein